MPTVARVLRLKGGVQKRRCFGVGLRLSDHIERQEPTLDFKQIPSSNNLAGESFASFFHKHLLGDGAISRDEMSKHKRFDSCDLCHFARLFDGKRIARDASEKAIRNVFVVSRLYGPLEHFL